MFEVDVKNVTDQEEEEHQLVFSSLTERKLLWKQLVVLKYISKEISYKSRLILANVIIGRPSRT